jgi:hypothetical protein
MNEEELYWFYNEAFGFVGGYTNFKSYENMTDEKKAKYREKLTLLICFEFSPRKNYDISMDEVRQLVSQALEYWRKVDE